MLRLCGPFDSTSMDFPDFIVHFLVQISQWNTKPIVVVVIIDPFRRIGAWPETMESQNTRSRGRS